MLAGLILDLKSQSSTIIFLVSIILIINIILWVQIVKIKNIVNSSKPKKNADKRLEKIISKKKFN